MILISALAGVLAAAGLWLALRESFRTVDRMWFTLSGAAGILIIAGLSGHVTHRILTHLTTVGEAEVDAAVAELRRVPLIAPMIADAPERTEEMRAAIRRDLSRHGRLDGNWSAFMDGLRRERGIPALRAASDARMIAIMRAREEALLWLKEHNPAACAAAVREELHDPLAPGPEFGRLWTRYLEAMERAYLDGRGKLPGALLDQEGIQEVVFGHLGMSENQFAVLVLDGGTADDLCAIGVQLLAQTSRIPQEHRARFGRTFLTAVE